MPTDTWLTIKLSPLQLRHPAMKLDWHITPTVTGVVGEEQDVVAVAVEVEAPVEEEEQAYHKVAVDHLVTQIRVDRTKQILWRRMKTMIQIIKV
eukprot:6635643-Ditylum_brightwellii.AAC.1